MILKSNRSRPKGGTAFAGAFEEPHLELKESVLLQTPAACISPISRASFSCFDKDFAQGHFKEVTQ